MDTFCKIPIVLLFNLIVYNYFKQELFINSKRSSLKICLRKYQLRISIKRLVKMLYLLSYKYVVTDSNHYHLVERTKKMASNLENRLRRIKDSTQDLGRNFFDHINMGLKNFATKNPITDDDIREYEHLVIMKKNPYLDIKDLEINYSPMSPKNARHSIKMGFDSNLQNEPGICDSIEDVLNVEIINRGLTGFAIPPQLTKHLSIVEEKLKSNRTNDELIPSTNKPTNTNVLTSLDEDITTYIENKNI